MTQAASNVRRHRPSRTWLFRLIAMCMPVALGICFSVWLLFQRGWLVVENNGIAFRRPPLYLEEQGHEVTGHRYLYDENLGWRNIPDWRATTFGKPLTINSVGHRMQREYGHEKPAAVKRILVLGDSYAWGYGVADDDLFCELLQDRLDQREPSWEVINTGVSGWGTDQQYLYLKQEGLAFDPDIVVLAFFIGNDVDNNVAATQYELNKPVFVGRKLALRNVPVPRPGRQVDRRVVNSLTQLDPVQHTVNIIAALSRLCEQHDIELVVMKFGIFLAPKLPYALDLERRFSSAMDQAGLAKHYFDLDERFREQGHDMQKLTAGNDDGHWNAFGHQQVAEELDEYLQQLPR